VKESSGDVRRISAIRSLLGDRVDVAVGLDDCVLEGVAAGAVGRVAGLAHALPGESRALYDAVTGLDRRRAAEIHRWFLPLLRMDTVPKFVQVIKAVEVELGRGNGDVRPPRLALTDEERGSVRRVLHAALRHRPAGLPGEEGRGPRP
jgi:1-pyrroline-4-hydroxy-2-carboxylate deaminase